MSSVALTDFDEREQAALDDLIAAGLYDINEPGDHLEGPDELRQHRDFVALMAEILEQVGQGTLQFTDELVALLDRRLTQSHRAVAHSQNALQGQRDSNAGSYYAGRNRAESIEISLKEIAAGETLIRGYESLLDRARGALA